MININISCPFLNNKVLCTMAAANKSLREIKYITTNMRLSCTRSTYKKSISSLPSFVCSCPGALSYFSSPFPAA